MINEISYRVCIWDQLPIEESPIFQTLLEENGVKFANRHSRRVAVSLANHPPPRGNDNVSGCHHMALARTGQHQLSSRSGLSRQAEYPDPIQTVEAG